MNTRPLSDIRISMRHSAFESWREGLKMSQTARMIFRSVLARVLSRPWSFTAFRYCCASIVLSMIFHNDVRSTCGLRVFFYISRNGDLG